MIIEYHHRMSQQTTETSPQADVSKAKRAKFLAEYEQKTTGLLSGLALVFLVTFSIQSIWPDTKAEWYGWMTIFSNLLWLLFAIDLLFRFIVSPQKRHFFRRNWLDTLTVVVPQLRALRGLRAFTANGILSKGKGLFSGGAVTSAVLGTIIIIWVGSLSVLNAERDASGATIKTLPDSIWWSFETISTVGYGDFIPVTWMGRSIAVLVMIVGISLLGAVSASLAATLVKQNRPDPAKEVMAELADLKQMVSDLQKQLANAQATTAPK